MDVSVRPQDDFFRYVNGKWVDNTPIPGDLASYGTFATLRDRAQEAVRAIVEGEAGSSAADANGQKVGAFYKSFMDAQRIESLGIQPLAEEIAAIDRIASVRDLPAAFARAARNGVRMPFAISVGPDQRNSSVYAVQIGQSGLGMPDRDYYLRNDEKFVAIRKDTRNTSPAPSRWRTAPIRKAPRHASLRSRPTIAEKQWDRARSRDRNATYNKMSVAALQASTPHFDWQAYLAQVPAGARDQVKDVIVRQPDFMTGVDAMFDAQSVAAWKEYLTFGLIAAFADDLSAPFAETQFEFTGKVIGGRQEMQPRWKRGVSAVEEALGEPIGRLYIARHFKPEAKARMDALIRNLLAAFKVGIDELEWMSPETKVQAQAKLAKYTLKIAYPDQWRDYSTLDVKPDDLVGNVLRFRQFQTADTWSRLGKPVERWRWGFTPQTVNASYSPVNNEITFPAGILQPPFFDMGADDAINYGAIGAVIGHEISHGFDDQGRKSDGDGNLRDWWTAEDARKFEERATKLGAQYQIVCAAARHEDQRAPDDGREHRRFERDRGGLPGVPDVAARQARAGHRRLHRRPALLPRLRADLALQVARRGATQSAAHRRPLARDVPRVRAADQHRRVLHGLQSEAGRQAVSPAGRAREDLVAAGSQSLTSQRPQPAIRASATGIDRLRPTRSLLTMSVGVQAVCISACEALASRAIGAVTLSTPLRSSARARAVSTGLGRCTDRKMRPELNSH